MNRKQKSSSILDHLVIKIECLLSKKKYISNLSSNLKLEVTMYIIRFLKITLYNELTLASL